MTRGDRFAARLSRTRGSAVIKAGTVALPAMSTLILVRHGESTWNKENRFTGWTDVDLSDKGVDEAKAAGQLLAAEGLDVDIAHTSVQKRAIRTLQLALEAADRLW